MKTIEVKQIDTFWEGLVERVECLKALDISDEADLEKALDESQRLLGAIAHCRHLLMQVEPRHRHMPRRAA